jgi:hypothetical protein
VDGDDQVSLNILLRCIFKASYSRHASRTGRCVPFYKEHMRLLLFFILVSSAVYSQKLKDKIQGDWVCMGITDSKGRPTEGKFGQSVEYLKFSFSKSKLYITESPYDKATPMDITFKNENSFDWLPGAVYDLPERIYEVKELDEKHLTLTTKGQNGEIITYIFSNQKNFAGNLYDGVIDNGILIVQHLRLSKTNTNNINRISEYRISNDSIFLSPGPTFDYSKGGSFGQIFSFNIKLPKDFKLDEVTEEMLLDFDVTEDGASNFRITKGLSDELDAEVIRVMEKLKKSWRPLVVNDKVVKTTSRFHLYFYMTISELQTPWK